MSDYQPTEADVRTAMLNRGFTEAEVSELLNNIKAEAWDEGMKAGLDNGLHIGERIIGTRRDWPDGPPPNPYRGGQ